MNQDRETWDSALSIYLERWAFQYAFTRPMKEVYFIHVDSHHEITAPVIFSYQLIPFLVQRERASTQGDIALPAWADIKFFLSILVWAREDLIGELGWK